MKEVIILAGGRGQRLRPYTDIEPKPMLRVGNRPILEFVIANIQRNGFKDVIIASGYMGEHIKDYFGNGSSFGLNIDYVFEKEPKNTAGALLELKDKVNENFIVAMGDHLTNINLRELYDTHIKQKGIVTIALKEMKEASEYGIVETERETVTALKEKPIMTKHINTAIYAMNKKVFSYITPNTDISKDIIPKMEKEKPGSVKSYVCRDYWMDIGRVKDYEDMRDLFSAVELYFSLFNNKPGKK